jgi:hypothetical protein
LAKLAQLAASAGEPLETYIPRLIAEEGSIHKAAVRAGVYPSAIRYWLKKNNRAVRRKTYTEVYVLDGSHE